MTTKSKNDGSRDTGVMRRRQLRFLALLLFAAGYLAPTPLDAQVHVWSELMEGLKDSNGLSVVSDEAGNVILAGEFSGDLNLPGSTLVSVGARDGFVAKFSASGQHIWSRSFGGPGNDDLHSVAVSPNGDVAVVGSFAGNATLGGQDFDSAGLLDIYVSVFKGNNGAHRWSRTFGAAENDTGRAIAYTNDGNVFVASSFQEAVNFGGATLVSAGSYDIAMATYNGVTGSHIWSRRVGGSDADIVNRAIVDHSDTIVIGGYFQGTTDLGSGPRPSKGSTDMFVATYSASNGSSLWVKTVGGTGAEIATGVVVDQEGNVLVSGTFGQSGGPVDFGGGAISTAGGADIFIAKYGPDGSYVWAKGHGGSTDDNAEGLAVDSAGNPAIVGSFQLTTNLGGETLVSAGRFDVLIAQYDSFGRHVWSKNYGNLVTEKGNSIAFDKDDHLIVTGFTLWLVDFGGGPLIATGAADAFLAKFVSDVPVGQPTPVPTNTPAATNTPGSTPPPATPPLSIAGAVSYSGSGVAVPGVQVTLRNPSRIEVTNTTSAGNYSVTNLTQGSWQIQPAKLGGGNGAITSLDASRVLQAAVGMYSLTGLEATACDVTGNGSVTALDASRILSLVVGELDRFPAAEACGSDWVFGPVPAQVANQSVVQPLLRDGICQPGSITLNPLVQAVTAQSFRAVLIGDCTGNWTSQSATAALQSSSADPPDVYAGRLRRKRGADSQLPIVVRTANPFHSLRVDLQYDAQDVELVGATIRGPGKSERDILISHGTNGRGKATVAVASAHPLGGGRGLRMMLRFADRSGRASRDSVRVVGAALDEHSVSVAQRGRQRPDAFRSR
jgi:hypothetical protein